MNTELILVRHGQPVLQNAMLGHTDSPLSDFGWQQLEKTFNCIEKPELLITSPLARCVAFAQQYSAEQSVSLVVDKIWQEYFFGDWDGQTYQSLHEQFPEQVSQFFSQPSVYPPPNGELLTDFSLRIEQALNLLLKVHQGKKIVLLTHAGVIRTLVAWCLKMNYTDATHFKRFSVDYASVTTISIYHDEKNYPQLTSLNQTFATHYEVA